MVGLTKIQTVHIGLDQLRQGHSVGDVVLKLVFPDEDGSVMRLICDVFFQKDWLTVEDLEEDSKFLNQAFHSISCIKNIWNSPFCL